ncbi:hypothetical protein L3Q82_026646 [Scortum barcoo]|uniref:Uncharacterized protein n=1 Tax=Scortum barcoo TaxID=214431 RepID=A0ACB8WJB2_9TELE|nr:hypothetical protein L3Q82_026646 [Scortum barcoo]
MIDFVVVSSDLPGRMSWTLGKSSYWTMLACGTPDAQLTGTGRPSKPQPGRSWRQKLGSGRSSVRPWRRTIGRPRRDSLANRPAPQKGEAVLCQHCLQCRWGAVDLD